MDTNNPYWSAEAAALMLDLGSRPGGLTSAEADERLQQHGANALIEQTRLTAARLLLHQFKSPLVLILVLGAAISLIVRDWVDAAIILAIVLGSALLGFFQEYRASNAVAELRQRLALTVEVLRNVIVRHLEAIERLVNKLEYEPTRN